MSKKVVKKKKKAKKKKSKRKPKLNGNNRNNNGQFKNGNKAAVGRKDKPIDEKAKALKKALLEAITEEDIKAIVNKMKSQAKAGDAAARKELFDRLWGRAIQEVDLGENANNTLVDIVARMCGDGDSTD